VETHNPDQNVSEVSSGEATQALEGQVAALTAERDRLLAEKTEAEDRLLRTRAEFENARKRIERERLDFVQFAGMEIVRELLPALDDFERALKAETTDREYAKGIELIYQRLSEALRKMGLEPIEALGRTFDPTLHEAVQRVDACDVEDQTIVGEFQKGYNFKGKLLRPAMVQVAVKS
jgi:molecular chaperone GrpE